MCTGEGMGLKTCMTKTQTMNNLITVSNGDSIRIFLNEAPKLIKLNLKTMLGATPNHRARNSP